MSHLLAHEGKESSVPAKPVEDEAEYSSSDENLDEKFASEEESSEEEYTVRVSHSDSYCHDNQHTYLARAKMSLFLNFRLGIRLFL